MGTQHNRIPSANTKTTVRLYDEDLELLSVLFPRGVAQLTRELVHAYCERLRARASGAAVAPALDMVAPEAEGTSPSA